MIVDTSVLIAVLLDEPDAATYRDLLAESTPLRLSAAGLVEVSIVVQTRKGDRGVQDLDLLLYKTGIEIVPVSVEQAELARSAYRRFGRGRHPAALNYGDCFAYALAKETGEPLLAKGSDFARTDVTLATRSSIPRGNQPGPNPGTR